MVAGDIVMVGVLGVAGILLGLAALVGRRIAPTGVVVGLILGGCQAVSSRWPSRTSWCTPTIGTCRSDRSRRSGRTSGVGSTSSLCRSPLIVVFLLGNVPWLIRSRPVSDDLLGLPAPGAPR